MTGLLDFLKTPEGQGLLTGVASYAAGAGRGGPVNSIGRGLLGGLAGYGQANDRQTEMAQLAKRNELFDMQLQQTRQGMDDKQRTRDWLATQSPQMMASQQALAGGGGPTVANAAKIPPVEPLQQVVWEGAMAGAIPVSEFINLQKPKEPKYMEVGGNLVRTDTPTPTVAFSAPAKPEATPASIREYQFAQSQGYQGTFDQWDTARRRAGASSSSTNVTYGAPVAGIGPNGAPVFFQPPNRAGEPPQIIPGIQPPKMADEIRDRQQQRQTTVQGIEDSLAVLDKAISHPGRATATGLSGAVDPRNYVPGTNARDFHVLKDQIGGKAFLQAFESLKGGGQITQVEGEKATAAIARLNTAQSDKEYLDALNEFRGIVAKGYERLTGQPYQPKGRSASGAVGGAKPSGVPMKGQVVDGYKFKGGNPADASSWEKQQ